MKRLVNLLSFLIADLRITRVRVVSQTFFFGLFLFLIVVTDLRYLKGYPASLFLELDPLVAVATAITSHSIYKGLILSLILLVPTLLLGRFFCNWICPYGTLHQWIRFFIWDKSMSKNGSSPTAFRRIQSLKYVLLLLLLGGAVFGSLQIGLLDPICLLHRSFTTAILPGINVLVPNSVYIEPYYHVGAWLIV